MDQQRKYKIKEPAIYFQTNGENEEAIQNKLDEVFDYIFSKVELAHLQTLSYDDNMTGEIK